MQKKFKKETYDRINWILLVNYSKIKKKKKINKLIQEQEREKKTFS